LALAASERLVRVFVDEGVPIGALLAQVAGRRAHSDPLRAYVEQLLAAFPASSGQGSRADPSEAAHPSLRSQSSALVETLSARELEVLRLIADGHSNQAIADSLIVAVSTVKRHINNIYGKLGVQSRTQALVRARELQLL
jgi:LuxR family maltose regulon positive regulatory protein